MNGDDTIAQAAFSAAGNKGVLAYPYLTLAAARTAAVSLSPAGTFANPRVVIKVFSGYYKQQLVLANFVDWDLSDATIDLQAGALYTIDDLNVACDSIIYGNATIKRSTAGTGGAYRTQNTLTNITVYADSITSSIAGNAVRISGGYFTGHINKPINSTGEISMYCAGNKTVKLYGDTTAGGAYEAFVSVSAPVTIYGDISSSQDYITATIDSGSTLICHGSITNSHASTGYQTISVASNGTIKLYGDSSCASSSATAYAIDYNSSSTSSIVSGDIQIQVVVMPLIIGLEEYGLNQDREYHV